MTAPLVCRVISFSSAAAPPMAFTYLSRISSAGGRVLGASFSPPSLLRAPSAGMGGTDIGSASPWWQVAQVTSVLPSKFCSLMARIILIISRAVFFLSLSSFSSGQGPWFDVTWQWSQPTPRDADIKNMAGINFDSGISLSTWMFLKASAAVFSAGVTAGACFCSCGRGTALAVVPTKVKLPAIQTKVRKQTPEDNLTRNPLRKKQSFSLASQAVVIDFPPIWRCDAGYLPSVAWNDDYQTAWVLRTTRGGYTTREERGIDRPPRAPASASEGVLRSEERRV